MRGHLFGRPAPRRATVSSRPRVRGIETEAVVVAGREGWTAAVAPDEMSKGFGEGDEPMALKEAASTLVAAGLAVDLVAVLAAITNSQPRVMTIPHAPPLPSAPSHSDDP